MTVAPATASPSPTSTGRLSPVSSERSTADVPVDDDAVGGDLLAGTDDEPVADVQLVDRARSRSLPSVVEARDVLRAELDERAQRRAGAALRARLEVPAGEQERDHDRRDLEVDLVAGAGA